MEANGPSRAFPSLCNALRRCGDSSFRCSAPLPHSDQEERVAASKADGPRIRHRCPFVGCTAGRMRIDFVLEVR